MKENAIHSGNIHILKAGLEWA